LALTTMRSSSGLIEIAMVISPSSYGFCLLRSQIAKVKTWALISTRGLRVLKPTLKGYLPPCNL